MEISSGLAVIVSMLGLYSTGMSESALIVDSLPLNTATNIGAKTAFTCASSIAYDQISWIFSNSTSTIDVVIGCVVVGGSSLYNLTSTSANCDLIIPNPTPALAGLYECQEISSGATYSAQLIIVLDSLPASGINVTLPDVKSGQSISMTGNLGFTQYQRPGYGLATPQASWVWGENGTLLPSQPVPFINTTYISSTLIVQATPPTVPMYICRFNFEAHGPSPSAQAINSPLWSGAYVFASKTVILMMPTTTVPQTTQSNPASFLSTNTGSPVPAVKVDNQYGLIIGLCLGIGIPVGALVGLCFVCVVPRLCGYRIQFTKKEKFDGATRAETMSSGRIMGYEMPRMHTTYAEDPYPRSDYLGQTVQSNQYDELAYI